MFESKMTTRSGWGQMTSMNSSTAPGFIAIPCPSHQEYSITNICKAPNCIEPLCPECIASHVQLHQDSKKPAKIENIITTRTTCIEQLAKMKYDAQKEIDQSLAASVGNVDQFLEAHQKRLDTAYKKIIKMVDDMFAEMNKQMQVISNAYLMEKDKKQKQTKTKLAPLYDFLARINEYKQELSSDDYIPALIELLNEPPRKPKYEPPAEGQNFGSVEINEKYLEDIRTDITKFVKVIVNCKDEGFKGRVQMNRTNSNGSNNMKFSRLDRSRSRDGSQPKIGNSRRSNSKPKIFGCESIVSDVRPATGSSTLIQPNANSIYQALNNNKQSSYRSSGNQGQKSIKGITYCDHSATVKINKASYFTGNSNVLWYFKEGTKYGFRAPLESIEAGFERVELHISSPIPQGHRSIILPNGNTFIIGGEGLKQQGTKNKVFLLNAQSLSFLQAAPMTQPRSFFGICYFQDFVYVAGGICSEMNKWGNKRILSDVQKYNIRQNRWQKAFPLPEPSYDFSMHAISSGKVLKFGGLTDARVFVHKIDVYEIYQNSWSSFQVDHRFLMASSPGIAQISNESLIIFGGRVPVSNDKISNCYILTQQEGNGWELTISQGPELYNEATFDSAFVHEGSVIAIQNNEVSSRNKLIMGYKHGQWKFISC